MSASAWAQGQPVPQGAPFRISAHAGDQSSGLVAMDVGGGFVVAWGSSDREGPGLGSGVYAQRFNALGDPIGDDLHVNAHTPGDQNVAAIDVGADGDFVVTWHGAGSEGVGFYARRFGADGSPLGEEFCLTTRSFPYGPTHGFWPSISVNADAGFILTWTDEDGEESFGAFAQRFDASGAPLGEAFQVNTTMEDWESNPEGGMSDDGYVVVVWGRSGSNGNTIFARRYDAAGAPLGAEFPVNTVTDSYTRLPSVAVNAEGAFVVMWGTVTIYSRPYDASGVPRGPERVVGVGESPTLGMGPGGSFVVAWTVCGYFCHLSADLYGQLYDGTGSPQGLPFVVDFYRSYSSSIAVDTDGGFVVVWSRGASTGSIAYGRRYAVWPVAVEPGPEGPLGLAVTPSPVRGVARVRYALAEVGPVRVTVHDALGREVALLYEGVQPAGPQALALDASTWAPGPYVVHITSMAGREAARFVVAQ